MAFHRPYSLFVIHFFQGRVKSAFAKASADKKHAPLNRANMRIWLKNRVFFVMVKFVSACVERDKKNFGFSDFCSQPPAHLTRSRSSAAGAFSQNALGYRKWRSWVGSVVI